MGVELKMPRLNVVEKPSAVSDYKRVSLDFRNFNGPTAGLVLTALAFALLFWLGKYFVSIERYERDQQTAAEYRDEQKADMKEMKGDIKEILRNQRK